MAPEPGKHRAGSTGGGGSPGRTSQKTPARRARSRPATCPPQSSARNTPFNVGGGGGRTRQGTPRSDQGMQGEAVQTDPNTVSHRPSPPFRFPLRRPPVTAPMISNPVSAGARPPEIAALRRLGCLVAGWPLLLQVRSSLDPALVR